MPGKANARASMGRCADRPPVGRAELGLQAAAWKQKASRRVGSIDGVLNPGLRVLSLFDGIGCVAYAMRQLGVPIESYIGCDIDSDTMNTLGVAELFNPKGEGFPGITRIAQANAFAITEEVIKALGRIDLVVGGPPCKDLSKARMQPDR